MTRARLAGVCFLLAVVMISSGCQTMRRWRASSDASVSERMKQMEKQVEFLTERLAQMELEMRFNVASNQMSIGKYQDAIRGYQELLNRFPESHYAADSLYEIAKMYKYNLKKPDEAIAKYEELLRRYPKSEFVKTASYEIAEILDQLGKKTDALVKYRNIITKFGRADIVEKAYFGMGDILQNDKQFAQARDAYQKLAETFPSGSLRAGALYRSAVCSRTLGDTSAALKEFLRVYTEIPSGDFAELAYFDRVSMLLAEHSDSDVRAGISQYNIQFPSGRFRSEFERFLQKMNGKKSSPSP